MRKSSFPTLEALISLLEAWPKIERAIIELKQRRLNITDVLQSPHCSPQSHRQEPAE